MAAKPEQSVKEKVDLSYLREVLGGIDGIIEGIDRSFDEVKKIGDMMKEPKRHKEAVEYLSLIVDRAWENAKELNRIFPWLNDMDRLSDMKDLSKPPEYLAKKHQKEWQEIQKLKLEKGYGMISKEGEKDVLDRVEKFRQSIPELALIDKCEETRKAFRDVRAKLYGSRFYKKAPEKFGVEKWKELQSGLDKSIENGKNYLEETKIRANECKATFALIMNAVTGPEIEETPEPVEETKRPSGPSFGSGM